MPGITLEQELQLLKTKLGLLASQRPDDLHSIRAKYLAINGLTAEITRIMRLIIERNDK